MGLLNSLQNIIWGWYRSSIMIAAFRMFYLILDLHFLIVFFCLFTGKGEMERVREIF